MPTSQAFSDEIEEELADSMNDCSIKTMKDISAQDVKTFLENFDVSFSLKEQFVCCKIVPETLRYGYVMTDQNIYVRTLNNIYILPLNDIWQFRVAKRIEKGLICYYFLFILYDGSEYQWNKPGTPREEGAQKLQKEYEALECIKDLLEYV
ncbi:MAG: hypothetical protein IKE65_06385 [Clostridia bacterium]|nr:hypothetical protein [Clostridia bacterium]